MRILSSAVMLSGFAVATLCGFAAPAQAFQEQSPATQDQTSAVDIPPLVGNIATAPSSTPPPGFGVNTAGVSRLGGQAEAAAPDAPNAVADPNYVDPNYYMNGYGPAPYPYGYPAGVDPSAVNAWPGISPFQHSFNQTKQRNGLWFNDSNNDGRKYYFGLEYIIARLPQPRDTKIGATNIVPFDINNPTSVFPSYDGGAFTQFNNIRHFIFGQGLRFRTGIENPDDSGVLFEGFWVGESKEAVRPAGRAFPGNTAGTLRARAGIPLINGQPGGITAPYDTDFLLEYKSQTWGADLNWYTTPFWGDGKGLRFRGIYGIKYLNINEQFHLKGIDSGLAYTINPDGSINPGTIVDLGIPQYQTDVFSSVRSQLAGPEIGLRYDIGGERLHLYGMSRLTAAANREQLSLYGQNLGDGFSNPFPPPTAANPHPTAFSLSSTHTFVTPVFDTAVYAEFPLFEAIPVLNKTRVFREANFRLGYQYLVAAGVNRPMDIIEWKTPAPAIKTETHTFNLSIFSFGVNWKW